MNQRIGFISLVLASLMVSCSPPQAQRQSQTAGASEPPKPSRALVVAHRYEPSNLAAKVLGSNGPLNTSRLFNATLALYDDKGLARPYLAEALPELNTDTWRLFPDGRMETTYRLRSGLTWQDGTPLTANDFAFALRVYKDPGLGVFIRTPHGSIDNVVAPDARTVLIQWKAPHPDAGVLSFGDLDPLPTHLLEAPFGDYAQGTTTRDGFLANSFWTTDYVGAGPFRLNRWDPGVQLQGTAFDGHALGRPKIDRIIIRITIDENTVLAAVLTGGQFDYTKENTLRFEHLLQLRNEWMPSGKGVGVGVAGTAVYLNLQLRPDSVGDQALLDPRVRRALAHSLDREALNDGVFNGIGFPTESVVPPSAPFYPDLDRAMTKYPLDANRADQLMADAGFTRDGEGLFANTQGRRLRVDFAVQNSPEIERMQVLLTDIWRRRGFDVRPVVMGVTQFTELRTRHTLPGLGYSQGPSENSYIAAEIGSAASPFSRRVRRAESGLRCPPGRST